MASNILLVFLALFLSRHAIALQVTPNSPCASLCQDSDTLDLSDPNSSNTKNSDIVCSDHSFTSKSAPAAKWKTCMSCLQNSTFTQGPENDQMWFLYNARYAFDFCIFGFPNATGVGSNPCVTSTACEPLINSLEDGGLDPKKSGQYGYCNAGDGNMTDTIVSKCLACVSASGDSNYLSNYLVALEAGCSQQPVPGKILGLNDTVFSSSIISIIDPGSIPTASPSGPSNGPPTTLIAAVVVAALAAIAIIAGVIVVWRKKRQAKLNKASPENFRRWGHHRQSSLSFRCQTHVDPMSPKFFPGGAAPMGDDSSIEEAVPEYPMSDQQQQHGGLGRRPSLWKPHNAISSIQTINEVSEYDLEEAHQPYSMDTKPKKGEKTGGITSNAVPLHSITTSIPAAPPTIHTSPSAFARFSPSDFATPSSTTSARSTTGLLSGPGIAPYNPAAFGVASPQRGPAEQQPGNNMFSSPVSASTTSPLLRQHGWPAPVGASPPLQQHPVFRDSNGSFGSIPPAPPPKSPRMQIPVVNVKKPRRESGSPIETRQLQVAFPAPPPRR